MGKSRTEDFGRCGARSSFLFQRTEMWEVSPGLPDKLWRQLLKESAFGLLEFRGQRWSFKNSQESIDIQQGRDYNQDSLLKKLSPFLSFFLASHLLLTPNKLSLEKVEGWINLPLPIHLEMLGRGERAGLAVLSTLKFLQAGGWLRQRWDVNGIWKKLNQRVF